MTRGLKRLFDFLMSGQRMKCPEFAPGYMYDIMNACWQTDPEQRPTFQRIVALLIREIKLSAYSPTSPSPHGGFGGGGIAADNIEYFRMPDIPLSKEEGREEEEQGLDSDGYLICLKSPLPPPPQ